MVLAFKVSQDELLLLLLSDPVKGLTAARVASHLDTFNQGVTARLEGDPEAQLNLTSRARVCDKAEPRVIDPRIQSVKISAVKCVKDIRSKGQVVPFGVRPPLIAGQVPIGAARILDFLHGGVSLNRFSRDRHDVLGVEIRSEFAMFS